MSCSWVYCCNIHCGGSILQVLLFVPHAGDGLVAEEGKHTAWPCHLGLQSRENYGNPIAHSACLELLYQRCVIIAYGTNREMRLSTVVRIQIQPWVAFGMCAESIANLTAVPNSLGQFAARVR